MQVVVLGMHRSGTSVVARILNLMGHYYSPEGQQLDPLSNLKGFWERKDVLEANKIVMDSVGATWHEIDQFRVAEISEKSRTKKRRHTSAIFSQFE